MKNLSNNKKTKNSYKLGLNGEYLALKYLEKLNYTLVKKRFKTIYGEIDLIVCSETKNEMLFVEVKSRNINSIAIKNMELITEKQKLRSINTAYYFLSLNEKYNDYQCRFDIIVISGNKIIDYITNAWEA